MKSFLIPKAFDVSVTEKLEGKILKYPVSLEINEPVQSGSLSSVVKTLEIWILGAALLRPEERPYKGIPLHELPQL